MWVLGIAEGDSAMAVVAGRLASLWHCHVLRQPSAPHSGTALPGQQPASAPAPPGTIITCLATSRVAPKDPMLRPRMPIPLLGSSGLKLAVVDGCEHSGFGSMLAYIWVQAG